MARMPIAARREMAVATSGVGLLRVVNDCGMSYSGLSVAGGIEKAVAAGV